MPVKTDEKLRIQAVEMKKAGKSWGEIQKTTGIARPILGKIFKEAGLTRKGGLSEYREKKAAQATGDGLSEFQPPAKQPAQRVKPTLVEKGEKVYLRCDHCGVVLEGEPGDQPPDTCPECGQ